MHFPHSWKIDMKIHFLNYFIRKLFFYSTLILLYGSIKCLWVSEMLIVLIGLFEFRPMHHSFKHSISQPRNPYNNFFGSVFGPISANMKMITTYYDLTFKLVRCGLPYCIQRWNAQLFRGHFKRVFLINGKLVSQNKLQSGRRKHIHISHPLTWGRLLYHFSVLLVGWGTPMDQIDVTPHWSQILKCQSELIEF